MLKGHPELKEITMWRNGCSYQDRMACVATAYSELARKYLVAGQIQIECDSMQSTIECKIVADIFTPRDYVIILQTARIRQSPYHVKVLKHDECLKINGSYFFQFSSECKVHFKLSFSEASVWEEFPQRVQVLNRPMA